MKQMETQKKDYIDKLKKELDLVEERWWAINNETLMVGEDYRSEALSLITQIGTLNQTVSDLEETNQNQQEALEKINETHCE
jgi:gas vesicle protein